MGFSFEGGVESGNLMLQLGGVDVRLGQILLGLFEFLLDFGEFAFQSQRTLGAGPTAGDCDVVEGFARG